ncbi:MAG: hypothetical protein O3C63_02890 [Cyanobacteria bacterium]|nr:hypothetical protein [Cyanobacteriota bacterium]
MVAIGDAAPIYINSDHSLIIGGTELPSPRHPKSIGELFNTRPPNENLVRRLVTIDSDQPLGFITTRLEKYFQSPSPNTQQGLSNYILIHAGLIGEIKDRRYGLANGTSTDLISMMTNKVAEDTSLEDVLQPFTRLLNQVFHIAKLPTDLLTKKSKEDLRSLAHDLIDIHFKTINKYKAMMREDLKDEGLKIELAVFKAFNKRLSEALNSVLQQLPSQNFADAHKAFDSIMERKS